MLGPSPQVELLSWKSVKELTADGGVIKTVVSEGTNWETAALIDGAVVSYRVTAPGAAADAPALASAERLELSSVAEAPCAGLTRALTTMKAGESALVQLKNTPEAQCACIMRAAAACLRRC